VSDGQRLYKPRLTFEDASLANSRADLSMRIVGGRQFHVGTDLNGGYRFNSMKWADALNGPVLHVRLELGDTPNALEPIENGRANVVIDMSKREWEFYLTFTDYPEENRLGGDRYKKIFSEWENDKKKFVLNTLAFGPDDFVQPAGFVVKTQAEPETLGTLDYAGEGAVVLFVKMQGSENGTIPTADRDFHYLLPDASPPYSTNVIFSQKYFLQRLTAQWFAELNSANEDRPFTFAVEGGDGIDAFSKWLRATQGVLEVPRYQTAPGELPFLEFNDGFKLAFADDPVWGIGAFGVSRTEYLPGPIACLWTGKSNSYLQARARHDEPLKGGGADFEWMAGASYSIGVDDDNRCYLKEELKELWARLEPRDEWTQYAREDPAYVAVIEAAKTHGREQIERRIREVLVKFNEVSEHFNLFLLHGLLFKGGAESIKLDKAYLPGDVVLPGYLAPAKTTLKLNTYEVTLNAGATFDFEAEPSNGVVWSVSNLPDEEGECGSIAASGRYTSPAATAIAHGQKIVMVTATSGTHVSRALVTIVKRTIALDPVIMTAEQISASDNRYKVSGATLQHAPLTWQMSPDAIGSIQVDPDPPSDVQDGRLYVVPKKDRAAATLEFNERYGKPMPLASAQWQARRAAGAVFSDEDLAEVLATEQIIVTGAGDRQTIDVLLPLENETHWFVYKPVAGSDALQLEFWSRTKKGEYQVPPEETEWFLVRGEGTLVDGLYTPPADGSESYAVVAAIEINERNYYWTYAILPMPYPDVASIIANEVNP
jgi:hypothetical protein